MPLAEAVEYKCYLLKRNSGSLGIIPFKFSLICYISVATQEPRLSTALSRKGGSARFLCSNKAVDRCSLFGLSFNLTYHATLSFGEGKDALCRCVQELQEARKGPGRLQGRLFGKGQGRDSAHARTAGHQQAEHAGRRKRDQGKCRRDTFQGRLGSVAALNGLLGTPLIISFR